jgi:UDP-N-acetylglucosamine:LPS N-acetylglucosamine transferase
LKTILIFTAGFGEGHNTAARNLRDALLYESDGDVEVEVLDLYDIAYGRTNDFARRLYLTVINKAPRLWNLLYKLLDRPGLFEATLFLQNKLKQVLEQTLTAKNPSAICCTYPGYNYLIEQLVAEGMEKNFFHATMVTDSISINSIWHRAASDAFIVPNEATAEVMAQKGVPRAKLHSFGFPVQLDFALPERRLQLEDPANGEAKVLYIINSGKDIAPALVKQLLAVSGIKLTVTIGRDDKLRERIGQLIAGDESRVEIIGWTNQIPQLLMTHHLVITKAGGATTQEAVAAECPVIFSQMIPGQEEGNWELLRRADAGYLVMDHRKIPGVVAEIFHDRAKRWCELRANLHKISQPQSALTAARFLLQQMPVEQAA